MKKLYLFLCAMMAGTFTLTAQTDCSNGRYGQELFSNVTVTSDIVYGNNLPLSNLAEDLMLDIYEPQGDTDNNRPLVIVAHGGSFVGGSKDGVDVVPICEDLAKRGFVVASISYRLGIENLLLGPDSTDGAEAVIRGTHDGKAAVRFFRKDVAENNNTYRIDTDNIYFGGVSAGGFIALNVAYFDKDSEIPSYVDTSKPNVDGTAEGNSGNPGYSSEVKAIFNVAGAIADTNWMEAGDVPVISLHGDQDNT
ncbi:MAG: alpha/beta hydrolase, partial [Salibacteraceae bacterium]